MKYFFKTNFCLMCFFLRLMHFVRGYFGWLPVLVRHSAGISLVDRYAAVADFFDDGGSNITFFSNVFHGSILLQDGFYRDVSVSQNLKDILADLGSSTAEFSTFCPSARWKQRPLSDL